MQLKKLWRMTIAFIASVCMLFSFVACGDDTPTPDDNTGDNPPVVNPPDDNPPDVNPGPVEDPDKHTFHTYEWKLTEDPTCLTKGMESDICSCGDIRDIRYVPALGHDMQQGVCTLCGRGESDDFKLELNEDGSYSVKEIGKETDLVLPSSYNGIPITAIKEGACYNRVSLTSVTLPDSITTIGKSAFADSGITVLKLGSGLTEIEDGAFSRCESLESIIISEDNPKYYTEGNCIIEIESKTLVAGFLTSQIPDDVTAFGAFAFAGCSFSSFVVPDNVTSIGKSAFHSCTNLTSITLNSGLTTIGETAFYGCKLSTIVIPASVTKIEAAAFIACKRLEEITYEGTKKEWNEITKGSITEEQGFLAWNYYSNITTIHCSDEDIEI